MTRKKHNIDGDFTIRQHETNRQQDWKDIAGDPDDIFSTPGQSDIPLFSLNNVSIALRGRNKPGSSLESNPDNIQEVVFPNVGPENSVISNFEFSYWPGTIANPVTSLEFDTFENSVITTFEPTGWS